MEEQKICKHCNNKFSQGKTTNFKWITKVFCSKKCQFDYIIENNKEKGSWNKGKHPEYMQKENHWAYGTKFSDEYRRKLSNAHKGKQAKENNPAWKGGVTSESKLIRSSAEYKIWKNAVFSKDNFTCQKTGIRGGDLVAHHIHNFADFPELRLAIDNGITLSKKAHRQFHEIYGFGKNTKEQLLEFLNN